MPRIATAPSPLCPLPFYRMPEMFLSNDGAVARNGTFLLLLCI